MGTKEQERRSSLLERKGAQTASAIPAEVLDGLNSGQLASVNLTEWLAVDHIRLLGTVLGELGLEQEYAELAARLQAVERKAMRWIPAIAKELRLLSDRLPDCGGERLSQALSTHLSDSVRCWAAYMVVQDGEQSLALLLQRIRPFAADVHFGVREIAWMAVREPLAAQLTDAITLLQPWVLEDDPNVRRFAVEVLRPQGVWARHIAELKQHPGLALPLLEPLRSDEAQYVQDSVSNWLNDASKTQPAWVVEVCDRWLALSQSKATQRIVKRARRTIDKK